MADVTGPISTLPGATRNAPVGIMCDDHNDRPAVKRVQGETDSFGCEMMDMCQECYDQFKSVANSGMESGECDWCGNESDTRIAYRDIDEGSCGPVYYVCQACRVKDTARHAEELDY